MKSEEEGFWDVKKPVEEQKENTEEMNDSEMGSMKLKAPKPVFNEDTPCKIMEAKFFKIDKLEKDSKQVEYTPFQVTVTFAKKDNDAIEFKETYRGGRLYNDPNGTSVYIGPNSSLGRFKAVCIEGGIKVGNTVKDFAEAVKGLDCVLKSETVMFAGKKYEKNFVQSVVKPTDTQVSN